MLHVWTVDMDQSLWLGLSDYQLIVTREKLSYFCQHCRELGRTVLSQLELSVFIHFWKSLPEMFEGEGWWEERRVPDQLNHFFV